MPNAYVPRHGGTASSSAGPGGGVTGVNAGASHGSQGSPPAARGTKTPTSRPSARAKLAAHVTHAERDGIHVLRYFGRVNYMSAPAIQRFLDDLFDQRRVCGVIFDLSDAEALDSTNLGLLARVNERVRDLCHSESMIVSRNCDITDVLLSMGFDQSFALVTEPSVNGSGNGEERPPLDEHGSDIDTTPAPSQAELHSTMLDAHRALVRLSDAGRLQFQDVVACLESDRPSH